MTKGRVDLPYFPGVQHQNLRHRERDLDPVTNSPADRVPIHLVRSGQPILNLDQPWLSTYMKAI